MKPLAALPLPLAPLLWLPPLPLPGPALRRATFPPPAQHLPPQRPVAASQSSLPWMTTLMKPLAALPTPLAPLLRLVLRPPLPSPWPALRLADWPPTSVPIAGAKMARPLSAPACPAQTRTHAGLPSVATSAEAGASLRAEAEGGGGEGGDQSSHSVGQSVCGPSVGRSFCR